MNFTTTLTIGKTAIFKKRSFFLFLSLFLLSSCSVLKNAGIEKRKYRPGFFIEGSSRKVIDTEKSTVDANYEPDLYCMGKVHLPDKELNETVQKKRNESLKQNVEKSKTSVLINNQKSQFNNGKSEVFYSIKKHEVSFKNNYDASVQLTKSDGKNYTIFQVILFVVAISIFYGILTLMTALFPIMSFAIALALSVLIWIPVFIVIWLILLTIKESIDKKHPNVLK
ncbi:MAG: hypothetical protein V4511_14275 [Bacteroidota bacterium]